MEVKFYDGVDDNLLKFVIIIVKYNRKWVFCKHRERSTYEIPGGHKEKCETIEETAARAVCIYSVTGKKQSK